VARVWKGLKADKDGPLGDAAFQTGQETIDIGADVEWFQRFRVPRRGCHPLLLLW
jgi:hypothetical protein